MSYTSAYTGIFWPYIVSGAAPSAIVFYAYGCYRGKGGKSLGIGVSVLCALAALVLCVVESRWLYSFRGSGFGLKPSAQLFSFFIVALALHPRFASWRAQGRNLSARAGRALVWLGRISFPVYLTHMLVIHALGMLGPRLDLPTGGFCAWAVVLCVDAVCVWAAMQLLPKRVCRWLGLF